MSDSPDVLQELDAWIALYPHANIAQRARDEIVALRVDYCSSDCFKRARAEALEEAVRITLEFAEPEITDNKRKNECRMFAARIAAAIRALKGRRDE